jgi:formylglycine-generating enzyme required for sulfatase activity
MPLLFVPTGTYSRGTNGEELEVVLKLCTQYWFNCDRGSYEDEFPAHRVRVSGFWIDQTEVTNRHYQICVDAGLCTPSYCQDDEIFNHPDQPVVCVDWTQASSYCAFVGGRLPTEAEWEFAAKGKKAERYLWGDNFIGEWVNYCDQGCEYPQADPAWDDGADYSNLIGQYQESNSWVGAVDMSGNVSEWVGDWYGKYLPGWKGNPYGPPEGVEKVIKGGSWALTKADIRAAWRGALEPDEWSNDLGFRCVMTEFEK